MSMLPVPIPDLERVLPQFFLRQRWYRAKAKNILQLQVADVIAISNDAWVVIVRIRYQDGEEAHYVIPFSSSGIGAPVSGTLRDALQNSDFRQGLLDAIASDRVFTGEHGRFSARATTAFHTGNNQPERLNSSVSRAEQSNSSIIFGQKYILKLFRKIEEGINPDIEIGTFLTERGFANTPAVLGTLEYRPASGDCMQAGILMQFVPNEGDAWKYTLQSLEAFFQAAHGPAPALPAAHPLDLKVASTHTNEIGSYLDSARLLGRRTAEMHRALCAANAGPEFSPEPFDEAFAKRLNTELLNQADITFELLRDKERMLAGEARQDATRLLDAEEDVRGRLQSLENSHVSALRIRHHGDYHLGQVLWTGHDFMIIDFEGEPARPLTDRRIKTLAMRDVAGMVRSFSYAGYAAIPESERSNKDLEEWADFWGKIVSAEYLSAYFEAAAKAAFVGDDRAEQKLLFDAFLLQKALYEVAYELNNRPDWVRIPLRGILSLIGDKDRRTQFA